MVLEIEIETEYAHDISKLIGLNFFWSMLLMAL